jgi:hypothetical protein
MRRGAGIVLASTALAACAVTVKPPPAPPPGYSPTTVTDEVATAMTRTATELVEGLLELPGATPLVPDDAPVALISFEFSEGKAVPHRGPLPVRGGSLAGDLTRASRNTSSPDYWLVVTDATGQEALYWTPIDGADRVRAEVPSESEKQDWEVKSFPNPANRVAVRVPFHPGAIATLFPTGGEVSVTPGDILSFGDVPPVSSAEESR